MFPVFDLISRMIGIDPGMSMIANNTMKQAKMSRKLICIGKIFAKVGKIRQEAIGNSQ